MYFRCFILLLVTGCLIAGCESEGKSIQRSFNNQKNFEANLNEFNTYLIEKGNKGYVKLSEQEGQPFFCLYLDLDNATAKQLNRFAIIPLIFEDTLKWDHVPTYIKTAKRMSDRLFTQVIDTKRITYHSVVIFLRAKNKEKYFVAYFDRNSNGLTLYDWQFLNNNFSIIPKPRRKGFLGWIS